jgi:hypothetical protein
VEGAGAGGVVVGKERKPVIFAMPKPKAVDKLSAQVHVLFVFPVFNFYFFFFSQAQKWRTKSPHKSKFLVSPQGLRRRQN